MASVGADKLLKVWDLAPFSSHTLTDAAGSAAPSPLRVTAAVVAHDKDINTVAIAPNDSLLATGSQDKTAKVWKQQAEPCFCGMPCFCGREW